MSAKSTRPFFGDVTGFLMGSGGVVATERYGEGMSYVFRRFADSYQAPNGQTALGDTVSGYVSTHGDHTLTSWVSSLSWRRNDALDRARKLVRQESISSTRGIGGPYSLSDACRTITGKNGSAVSLISGMTHAQLNEFESVLYSLEIGDVPFPVRRVHRTLRDAGYDPGPVDVPFPVRRVLDDEARRRRTHPYPQAAQERTGKLPADCDMNPKAESEASGDRRISRIEAAKIRIRAAISDKTVTVKETKNKIFGMGVSRVSDMNHTQLTELNDWLDGRAASERFSSDWLGKYGVPRDYTEAGLLTRLVEQGAINERLWRDKMLSMTGAPDAKFFLMHREYIDKITDWLRALDAESNADVHHVSNTVTVESRPEPDTRAALDFDPGDLVKYRKGQCVYMVIWTDNAAVRLVNLKNGDTYGVDDHAKLCAVEAGVEITLP